MPPIKRLKIDYSDATDALCKLMVASIYYHMKRKLDPTITTNMMKWLSSSEPLFKKFGIDKNACTAILNGIKRKINSGDLDDPMYELAQSIRENYADLNLENSLSREQLVLLKSCARWMIDESESALANIAKYVGSLNDDFLRKLFITRVDNTKVKNVFSQLEALVLKLTGHSGTVITTVEKEKINAEDYKQYLQLKAQIKNNYINIVMGLIRKSGKRLLDSNIVADAIAQSGLPQKVPTGFVGKIDELFNFYTADGDKLSLRGVAPGSVIEMNPKYKKMLSAPDNETYVLRIIPKGKNILDANRIYTDKHNNAKAIGKDQKIQKTASNLSSVLVKMRRGLVSKDTKVAMIATILELVWTTLFRIGTLGNATNGEPTYGVSTLVRENVTFKGTACTIKFKGKSGVPHKAVIKRGADKHLNLAISNLKTFWEATEPGQNIFKTTKQVKAVDVNKYLATCGAHINVHGFRRLRGTDIAQEVIDQCPLLKGETSQKEAEDYIKQVVGVKVGTALNHRTGITESSEGKITSTTAIANYIPKDLLSKFFVNLGLRVPEFVRKIKG